ncbi:MAG: DUF4286 family protein [Mucilaginibacter sp.]
MIIYNETIIMDEGTYEEWLNWMQTVHIPSVMNTGYFDSYRMLNIIDSPNEGISCCVQYATPNLENYRKFVAEHQQQLQAIHHKQFENKFVLFGTLMQTID